jgi:hypothetical protein
LAYWPPSGRIWWFKLLLISNVISILQLCPPDHGIHLLHQKRRELSMSPLISVSYSKSGPVPHHTPYPTQGHPFLSLSAGVGMPAHRTATRIKMTRTITSLCRWSRGKFLTTADQTVVSAFVSVAASVAASSASPPQGFAQAQEPGQGPAQGREPQLMSSHPWRYCRALIWEKASASPPTGTKPSSYPSSVRSHFVNTFSARDGQDATSKRCSANKRRLPYRKLA